MVSLIMLTCSVNIYSALLTYFLYLSCCTVRDTQYAIYSVLFIKLMLWFAANLAAWNCWAYRCTITLHIVFVIFHIVKPRFLCLMWRYWDLWSKKDKWSKWCAQTLHPFSEMLKIFLRIGAPIVAQPSDNFQFCLIHWKALFFPEKNAAATIHRSLTACSKSRQFILYFCYVLL